MFVKTTTLYFCFGLLFLLSLICGYPLHGKSLSRFTNLRFKRDLSDRLSLGDIRDDGGYGGDFHYGEDGVDDSLSPSGRSKVLKTIASQILLGVGNAQPPDSLAAGILKLAATKLIPQLR
ncbi:UNVERIFIED_CONTAM: hypothetical protein RMT77_019179 [Armadillidium vulgare]